MSGITISGRVIDSNGNPTPNARVRIYDEDIGGQRDRILDILTDSLGTFSGQSREWRDLNYQQTPAGRIPLPDLLNLSFTVTKSGRTHSGPFFRISDTLSVDIKTPWVDPEAELPIAIVQGNDCRNTSELSEQLRRVLTSSPDEIRIVIWDPIIRRAFAPLAELDGPRRLSSSVRGITEGLPVPTPPDLFWVLVGVSIIIVAVGATAGTVIMGGAVIYAISEGYTNISFGNETRTGSDGSTSTGLVVRLEK